MPLTIHPHDATLVQRATRTQLGIDTAIEVSRRLLPTHANITE